MNLTHATYTTFDFETTGLFAGGDQICEIGALRCGPDDKERRYEQLVDPLRQISEGAYNMNRITPEMLKGKPTIEEVLPEFMEFIQGSILLAYNARFDMGFLAAALGEKRTVLNDYQVIDVLEVARRCFNVPSGYSLGKVAAHFGIKQDIVHRAMPDVVSTWKIFKRAIPILKENGIEAVEDIARVYHQSDLPIQEAVTPIVGLLTSAIRSKTPVKITYRSTWKNDVTERTITPLRIQGEYLYSFCHLRGENRTFLLECIENAEI